jgi:histidyl-tRNA synthetase
MKAKYTLPRGTYDILPNESWKWHIIRTAFQKTASLFSYQEIVTPIFEQAALFERSVGDTSDIIQKEMYKFEDKKGRQFALRPEGTAPVVRSIVEHNLLQQEQMLKLCYSGAMFRYDRPQKGRYRQFYQYGIEFLGNNHPYYDAEVIAFADFFLRELGLKNFQLEINSIGCSACSQDFDKALIAYFLPHEQELCQDCTLRLEKNPKRILDCKIPSCKKIAQEAPSMLDYLDSECALHFAKVQEYLEHMEIPYKVNPKIVRGLDYYTQTAFEFTDSNLGAQSTLIGGGRYNKLVSELGGKDVSGIGFAGGFERLLLSMETENLLNEEPYELDIFVVIAGDELEISGIQFIHFLRKNSFSTEFAFEKKSVRAQMKAADKSNAKFVILLGEEELKEDKIVVRKLQSGVQTTLAKDDLISFLRNDESR